MEITTALKKRFCKDFKLPINVFSEPYFEYFTSLYNGHYKITEKLEWLKEVLKDCGTQEDFFGMSEKLAKNIKTTILNTKAYEKFNTADLAKDFQRKEQITQQNIYIVPNVGKPLISVDLEKANFNCLNLFGLKEELGAKSYDDLVKKFTPYEYFLNSKMIRQIIFGDLNPSRQQKVQKYIINNLCSELLKEGCTLSSASSDEIIISNDISVEKVKEILKNVPEEFKFFRVESFSFDRIEEKQDFLIKKTLQSNNKEKLEFKNVPGHLHAQIFKKYYNQPINDNDLLFYHEGFLAQFKEPLFVAEPIVKNKNKP